LRIVRQIEGVVEGAGLVVAELIVRSRISGLAVTERELRRVEVDREVVEALRRRIPDDLRVAELAHREPRELAQVALVDERAVAAVDPVPQVDRLDVAGRAHRTGRVRRCEVALELTVPTRADGGATGRRGGDLERNRRRMSRTSRTLPDEREVEGADSGGRR